MSGTEDRIRMFNPERGGDSDEAMVAGAKRCIEDFGRAFNAGDPAAMDRCLSFPHVLLVGSELMVWEKSGQTPADFFDALRRQGWSRTDWRDPEPLLVSQDKVHFRVKYTREREDGSAISGHENIWIVTRKNNRWGIAFRSY